MTSILDKVPSTATLLSAYAAFSTFIVLIRSVIDQIVSQKIRELVASKICDFFAIRFSSDFTFEVENGRWDCNETFWAAEAYLPTKIGPSTHSLRVLRSIDQDTMVPAVAIPDGGKVVDEFDGMKLTWTLGSRRESDNGPQIRYYHLTCKRTEKDRVLHGYLPFVIRTAQAISDKRKCLKIHSYNEDSQGWQSSDFNHPATFDTLAMEPALKRSIIGDLDKFVGCKDYFKRVGRAWKRGYLLHGPPGTGKSTLVAAMANHLRYDIYDLQFASVRSDFELRNILTSTTNRSILLIEDIDCNCKVSQDRDGDAGEEMEPKAINDSRVTLSGLLNFIDGLWSSFGDERIIVFTTNHKEKLDPALLRPGRMDFHIYMGYCTPAAFRMLASMYLGVGEHKLFQHIEDSIRSTNVTPAEVAQQLMASNNADIALGGLVEFLSTKKSTASEGEEEQEGLNRENKGGKEEDGHEGNRPEGWEDVEKGTRSIYLT